MRWAAARALGPHDSFNKTRFFSSRDVILLGNTKELRGHDVAVPKGEGRVVDLVAEQVGRDLLDARRAVRVGVGAARAVVVFDDHVAAIL